MTDARLIPANGRVAAAHLKGRVDAVAYVDGKAAQICVPIADLRADPGQQGRARQMLFGETLTVFETRDGMAFVQSDRDGYVGYVSHSHLSEAAEATHFVSARSAHLFAKAGLKGAMIDDISFGSRLRIVSGHGDYSETHDGYFIWRDHIRPITAPLRDPVTVAQQFFGTPYLWGGNSHRGIDCSGLVQSAMMACNIACPADSDQQEASLGEPLDNSEPVHRGDLFFWKGHVAIAVDSDTIIHANAGSMAVSYEPIDKAIERIIAQGEGEVTSRKRL
ncbi:MAG: C40 family peptidase [Marinosulfonomonas sp.]|nr:C40 family peptidase [Marinosulfonomonas sp.]